jgi:hypothetical protein
MRKPPNGRFLKLTSGALVTGLLPRQRETTRLTNRVARMSVANIERFTRWRSLHTSALQTEPNVFPSFLLSLRAASRFEFLRFLIDRALLPFKQARSLPPQLIAQARY